MPQLQLLSNGSYHVTVTDTGHGYSVWRDLAVTRWCADSALDGGGTRCYVREHSATGEVSTGPQNMLLRTGTKEHDFSNGCAVVRLRNEAFATRSEFAVAVDDPVELRRVVITNNSERRLTLTATSYAEIVLSPLATDSAHPAFSKLFVQTEVDPALHAILATRRPSTSSDPTPARRSRSIG